MTPGLSSLGRESRDDRSEGLEPLSLGRSLGLFDGVDAAPADARVIHPAGLAPPLVAALGAVPVAVGVLPAGLDLALLALFELFSEKFIPE